MSDNISKSIMIVNVPMIAFFIYLMAFKKRRFYFDSLIFALHLFSFLMFSWVMLDWMDSLIGFLPDQISSILWSVSGPLFIIILPLLYATLSIKRWMSISWYWSIPAGLGALISVFIANAVYRFFIFLLTFWAT